MYPGYLVTIYFSSTKYVILVTVLISYTSLRAQFYVKFTDAIN